MNINSFRILISLLSVLTVSCKKKPVIEIPVIVEEPPEYTVFLDIFGYYSDQGFAGSNDRAFADGYFDGNYYYLHDGDTSRFLTNDSMISKVRQPTLLPDIIASGYVLAKSDSINNRKIRYFSNPEVFWNVPEGNGLLKNAVLSIPFKNVIDPKDSLISITTGDYDNWNHLGKTCIWEFRLNEYQIQQLKVSEFIELQPSNHPILSIKAAYGQLRIERTK